MSSKMYVDIDSLFDTRYPIIYSATNIEIESYLTRYSDDFKYIGARTMRELYDKRDRHVLLRADVTPIHEIIVRILNARREEMIEEGDLSILHVDINYYPFVLNDDDLSTINSLLVERFSGVVTHSIIRERPTGSFLSSYFSVVSYDALSYASRAIIESLSPLETNVDTQFVAPALLEENHEFINRDKYFLGLMDATKTFINLQFINVVNFCSIRLIDKLNRKRNRNGSESNNKRNRISEES